MLKGWRSILELKVILNNFILLSYNSSYTMEIVGKGAPLFGCHGLSQRGMVLGNVKFTESPHIQYKFYLTNLSRHHPPPPTFKRTMLSTLVQRDCTEADPQNLLSELRHVKEVFQQNGYSRRIYFGHCGSVAGRKKPDEVEEKARWGCVYSLLCSVVSKNRMPSKEVWPKTNLPSLGEKLNHLCAQLMRVPGGL